MTGNGKAIAHALLLGGSLLASASAIGGIFYWGGALAEGQVSHEKKACHEDACKQLSDLKSDVSGLKATVKATGKATDEKIEGLKQEQRRGFDRLEQLLRQQN